MGPLRQTLHDKADERAEQAVKNAVTKLQTLVITECGIDIVFNGDPRGPAVKLRLSKEWEHLHDCWGREGVCVP